MLIPVFSGGEGAHGAQWETRLTIVNSSDKALTSIGISYNRDCGIPEGCIVYYALPAQSSFTSTATSNALPAGFFINIATEELPHAAFALRVYDRGSATLDHGTEIPVVPANAFRRTEIQLLDVPLDPHFRVTLRVYGLPGLEPTVVMKVFQNLADSHGAPHRVSVLVSERTLSLQAPPTAADSVDTFPSSLVLVDPLSGITPLDAGYRITLQTQNGDMPIWGFATVTSNDSQRVTVISPQLP